VVRLTVPDPQTLKHATQIATVTPTVMQSLAVGPTVSTAMRVKWQDIMKTKKLKLSFNKTTVANLGKIYAGQAAALLPKPSLLTNCDLYTNCYAISECWSRCGIAAC